MIFFTVRFLLSGSHAQAVDMPGIGHQLPDGHADAVRMPVKAQHGDGCMLHVHRPRQVWDRALESKFRNSTAEEKARWIRNAYRVNLTRARQGMVIYVPYGSDDPLDVNYHGNYDGVYEYLTKEIGLPTLDGVAIAAKGEDYKMAGPDMKRIHEKLLQLKTLYESGAIYEKDYESRKNMVLDNWLQE